MSLRLDQRYCLAPATGEQRTDHGRSYLIDRERLTRNRHCAAAGCRVRIGGDGITDGAGARTAAAAGNRDEAVVAGRRPNAAIGRNYAHASEAARRGEGLIGQAN